MPEEDFGCVLPELTYGDIAQSLRKEISASKKNIIFSFLGAVSLPYVAEKGYGKLSEPWNSTVYSGMMLLEIFALGACLYSAYAWRQTSKRLGELEEMVGAVER